MAVVRMMMVLNEDALASPAVALFFITWWTHKAYSQTGCEGRQVVVLYWSFRQLLASPASL